MHHPTILTTLLLLLLLQTTSAAPLVPPENPHPRALLPRTSKSCGVSSYKGETTSASPLIHDCLQINENITKDATWLFVGAGWRTILTYGTCAFGAASGSPFGNEDVTRLIVEAVMRHSWEDRIGASGAVSCDGGNPHKWGIYHTKK